MKERPGDTVLEVGGVKAKALGAAAQILSTRGADALNLRAIAESAGIGLASIYHYFANKDELLVSLAVNGFAELQADIMRYQVMPEHSPAMRASARAFFAFAQNRPALFSLMFNERLMTHHEALREAEKKTLLTYQAAVETDDRIPPQHRANAAFALWALGRGMAAIISSYPHDAQPPELIESLFAGASYLLNHPD